jgi:hypothetical protein
MSDIGYRIKVYSDIRYNVGLRSLQSDIGSSGIKLSPISLITDIGVSAHLCKIGIENEIEMETERKDARKIDGQKVRKKPVRSNVG